MVDGFAIEVERLRQVAAVMGSVKQAIVCEMFPDSE